MRTEFHAIIQGWMRINEVDHLAGRIARCAAWQRANGPLEPDEQAALDVMARVQAINCTLKEIASLGLVQRLRQITRAVPPPAARIESANG